jgi:hypothetical protein
MHTKEPWKVSHDGTMYTVTSGNVPVAWFSNHHDAWRCVTCVNRCRGLTNKALDADVIGILTKYAISLRDFMDWLKRESPAHEMLAKLSESLELLDDILGLTEGD